MLFVRFFSFRGLLRLPLLSSILVSLAQWRAREKIPWILPHLQEADLILEIGAGNAALCSELQRRGYRVVALDLEDKRFRRNIDLILYAGGSMPFRNDRFNSALLVTVLHHTASPESVLAEARRIASKIVIVEEIFSGSIRKYITFAIDSLFNLEFFGHPHSNKTDAQWRQVFERLNLHLESVSYYTSCLLLRRVVYVLNRGAVVSGAR